MDCNSFPGLKRTGLPGGMDTSAPVRGLRPIPVLRGRTLKTPNPRNSMRLPPDSAFFMLSKTVSTASSALVLVMPVLATTSLMMSSLITSGSVGRPRMGIQLIDAMGDKQDCQREHLSRKLACTQPTRSNEWCNRKIVILNKRFLRGEGSGRAARYVASCDKIIAGLARIPFITQLLNFPKELHAEK